MRRPAIIVLAVALGACATLQGGMGTGSSALGTLAGDRTAVAPAPTGDDTVMPNLIGKTREEAIALVAVAGFTHPPESSRPVECEGAPEIEGKISCQDPEPGQVVKKTMQVQINVYGATRIAGAIVRAQLKALLGLAPEEAQKKLASYGHDGTVKVRPGARFYDGCGENRVCAFDVPESGMGVHDPITLYINPGLKISGPPQ